MAVVIRCSSLSSTGGSSPFPGKSNGPEYQTYTPSVSYQREIKLASLLLNVGKFGSPFGDASMIIPLEKHQMFFDGIKGFKSDRVQKIDQVHLIRNKLLEGVLAHQGEEQARFTAKVFLITNALMMTTPLEVLAETCEAGGSFLNMNMSLLLLVALVGATVGGLVARQRKGELQRVNEQLRQINAALTRQVKLESYAPTLSYAPVGANKIPESEVIVHPQKQELISRLKAGKNLLRNQDPEKAHVEFKAALELAKSQNDPTKQKKAARGLGASLQRQGKYRDAIKYHSRVLAISRREGEESGNTEAYGAIADCYTELGDLEQAGKYYDKYIARLETD